MGAIVDITPLDVGEHQKDTVTIHDHYRVSYGRNVSVIIRYDGREIARFDKRATRDVIMLVIFKHIMGTLD